MDIVSFLGIVAGITTYFTGMVQDEQWMVITGAIGAIVIVLMQKEIDI